MSRPEPTIGNPKNTIEILQKYKFVFQKKIRTELSVDEHVLRRSFRRQVSDRMILLWRSGRVSEL